MEFSGRYGFRAGFLWLSLSIILTLSSAKLQDPRKNVNLSPFWQWTSAYECLQNTSTICGTKNLNLSGTLQVTGSSQVADYCNGCAHWTRNVLTCIDSVERDFWFSNNATVKKINESISQSCSKISDINITGFPRSAGMRNFSGAYMALFSALVLAIFLFSN